MAAGRLLGSFGLWFQRLFPGVGPAISENDVCSLDGRILRAECAPDEVVLFDIESRSVYLLNHTAADIVRLTDGITPVGKIITEIARGYREPEKVVARDVKKIYYKLRQKGIIAMSPDRTARPKITRDTVIRREDDGAFLFDPVTDGLSAVNEIGLFVVSQIDGKKSVADIIQSVADRFSGADIETIGRDVEAFIDELKDRGFVSS